MPGLLRYGNLQIAFGDDDVVLQFWDPTLSDLPQSVPLSRDQAVQLRSALSEWLDLG